MSHYPTMTIGLADAKGGNELPIASGERPLWSPDSKQMVFFGGWRSARVDANGRRTGEGADEIKLYDVVRGSLMTLARVSDLMQLLTGDETEWGWLDNMAWSPDSRQIAVSVSWSNGSAIVVLDAKMGTVRARWQWPWTRAWFPAWAWSPDSRRLVVWISPDSMPQGKAGLLDVQTGAQIELPGKAFGWSADGKWLALAQDPSGVLLTTPDQASTRWLDTPDCFDVAWRPDY
jgi:WD40 repeat protein